MPLWWISTSGSAPRWRKSKRRKCCSTTSGRTYAFTIGGLIGITYAKFSRWWTWSVSSSYSSFFFPGPCRVNIWALRSTASPRPDVVTRTNSGICRPVRQRTAYLPLTIDKHKPVMRLKMVFKNAAEDAYAHVDEIKKNFKLLVISRYTLNN